MKNETMIFCPIALIAMLGDAAGWLQRVPAHGAARRGARRAAAGLLLAIAAGLLGLSCPARADLLAINPPGQRYAVANSTAGNTFVSSVTVNAPLQTSGPLFLTKPGSCPSPTLKIDYLGNGFASDEGNSGGASNSLVTCVEGAEVARFAPLPQGGWGVGIGTAAPTASLNVAGTVLIVSSGTLAGALNVSQNGTQTNNFPNAAIETYANTNSYFQSGCQNFSLGNAASCDYIWTSALGGNATYYMDAGINGPRYNQAGFTAIAGTEPYILVSDARLYFGSNFNNNPSIVGGYDFGIGTATSNNNQFSINPTSAAFSGTNLGVNALLLTPESAPAAQKGLCYFDSSLNVIKCSENGSTYVQLATGSVSGNFVNLQNTSPGSQQSGSLNLSGMGVFGASVTVVSGVSAGSASFTGSISAASGTFTAGLNATAASGLTAVTSYSNGCLATPALAVDYSNSGIYSIEGTPSYQCTVSRGVGIACYGSDGSAHLGNPGSTGAAGTLVVSSTSGLSILGSATISSSVTINGAGGLSVGNGAGGTTVFVNGVGALSTPALAIDYNNTGFYSVEGSPSYSRWAVRGTLLQSNGSDGTVVWGGTLSSATYTMSGTLSVNSGTTQLYYCNAGVSAGNMCRGNGCSCAGGSWVAEGVFLP